MASPARPTEAEVDLTVHALPSANVAAAIRREVSRDLKPVRLMARSQRVAICFSASAAVVASLWLSKGAFELSAAKSASAVAWVLVVLLVLWSAFPSRVGGKRRALRLSLLLALPLSFLGYLALSSTSVATLLDGLSARDGAPSSLTCGVESLALGALAATAVGYVWRRSDPFTPRITGALAGIVSGISGALAIGLVCPGQEAWHLTIGHGSAVLLLAVLGATLGRKVISP